jgi:thioredoxin reductase (NADPH)
MYDLIIIGGGPAGLSAAIYAARFMMKVLVLAKVPGGTISEASIVGNYPGYVSISGFELMQKIEEQAKNLGVEIEYEEATDIKEGKHFVINKSYEGKYILIASGTNRRKLNVPGEKQYAGKGVSYCFTCDAPLFREKRVAVVGGSDSAATAALLLRDYATKVYIIYRKEKLRAEPILIKQIEREKKIEIITNTLVTEIRGRQMMTSVMLNTGKELEIEGLFVEIGADPENQLAGKLGLKIDDEGYITVDKAQKTSRDKVYAAGDITNNSNKFRQVITACAEGAVAAESIYDLIKMEKR